MPEPEKKEETKPEIKPDEKIEDTIDVSKVENAAKDDKKETNALSDEDKAWLEMKKYNVSPSDMLAYAQKGWEALNAEKKDVVKDDTKKTSDTPSPDTDDDVPLSKKEFDKFRRETEAALKIGALATLNQVKLDTLLSKDEIASNDPDARQLIAEKTWGAVAKGKNLEDAFKEASAEYRKKIATIASKLWAKKVSDSAAGGSSTSSSADEIPIPKFEHKASDIRDGTAIKQAVEFARSLRAARKT